MYANFYKSSYYVALDNLGFEFLSKWDCVPILVLFAVANALLVLLGLTYLTFERR